MNWHFQRIVETPDGVYGPPMWRLEAAIVVLALVLVGAAVPLGKISPGIALLYAAVPAIQGAFRWREFRKYGPLGRPWVAVIAGAVVVRRPADTRGDWSFALADLGQLVVYGLVGRRIFRFVRHDGTHVEVMPSWGRRVEQAAVEFLQRALPAVNVAEPQTLFASVRGDGP
jgi:hypothetical protein